jgi:hypothetical protein
MMKRKKRFFPKRTLSLIGFLTFVGLLASNVSFGATDFTDNIRVTGYLGQRVSMQMRDVPETDQDDKYDLSMIRSTAHLEVRGFYNLFDFALIGRADREFQSDYLHTLDKMSGADLERFYNNAEFREYYVDFRPWDNVRMRLGKQQVVWGRTDFFQAMDIVHGYDYTWRSFLEADNEWIRKPLVMANTEISMPEANGVLQLLWVPGEDFNKKEDFGHTYDLRGGRWALQPNKGTDFLTGGVPYNFGHTKADAQDDHYGLRWSGFTGAVEYSLSYFYGNNQDPVVNSIFDPWYEDPVNGFAEFIFPKIHLVGGTANAYVEATDMVVRTEIAYIFDKPYNVGQHFFIPGTDVNLPGFGGIRRYNTAKIMVGFDKPMSFVKPLFGARKDGFFTMQSFTNYIIDYNREQDDVVRLAGYGKAYHEFDTMITAVLGWNYRGDTINPQLAAGLHANTGEAFIIPSTSFVIGNNWRLYLEYSLWLPKHYKDPGEVEWRTDLVGWFKNNDQLYARLMYIF